MRQWLARIQRLINARYCGATAHVLCGLALLCDESTGATHGPLSREAIAAEVRRHVSTVTAATGEASRDEFIVIEYGPLERKDDGTYWRRPSSYSFTFTPADVATDIERRRFAQTNQFEDKVSRGRRAARAMARRSEDAGAIDLHLHQGYGTQDAHGRGAQHGEALAGWCGGDAAGPWGDEQESDSCSRDADTRAVRGVHRATHAPLTAAHKAKRGDSIADTMARTQAALDDRLATENALVTWQEESPTLDYLHHVRGVDVCPDELDAPQGHDPRPEAIETRKHFARAENTWAFAFTEAEHAKAFDSAVNSTLATIDLTPAQELRVGDALREVRCHLAETMRACANAAMSPRQTAELAKEWLLGAVVNPPVNVNPPSSGKHSLNRLKRYIGERARRDVLRARARAQEREEWLAGQRAGPS